MMPIRSLDSYPYQRNQMPFPHYYHPGIEAIPPKADPSKPPFFYDQRLPYTGNYGHPIPPNFCCGPNNFPCHYSYMPSYPHPPAPMYYSRGCSAYSEPYFVSYSPQPHYTMELPSYEYDKYMSGAHNCCGCPNSPCNQKEGKTVKIEEHEPDVGKKVKDALLPTQLKNYPYPFVWIPQEYTSNKQLKNPNAMEVGEQNRPSSLESSNADAQAGQDPRVWNGWFPFNIKCVPNMINDGDGIRNQKRESGNNKGESEDGNMNQKHLSEQKRSEFPFPIFWLPYYNKQEESGETNNQEKHTCSPKIIEELPYTCKSVPVKSHVDEGGRNRTGSNHAEYANTNDSDVVQKVTNARSIPVKQIESQEGNNVSLNQMEENLTKKDSCTNDKKRQSTSSPKGSKLPPVCLRVDPLPRKKNGNGSSSSRSPSPPSSKGHSQATADETFKTPVSGTHDKGQPNLNHQNASTKTSEKVKPKEKPIQVSEYETKENKGVDCKDGYQSQKNVNISSEDPKGTREAGTDGDDCKTENKKAEKGAENMMEETRELREVKHSSAHTDVGQKVRRVLSDADAAVLIQSAYRGYQVRKWEPLKKLKQIDEVKKEVTNVRGCVLAFERSCDLQNDDKQKFAIGETIMKLLLKLDTIQGLHPSLREFRKSLARELTILQERLDSIMAKKPHQQMQDFDVQKHVEVTTMNMQDEEHVLKQQEEKIAIPADSTEGISDDVKGICANNKGSECQTPVDPAPNEGAKSVLPNGPDSDDNSQVVTTADALNSKRDLSETTKTALEPDAKSEVNDIPIKVDKLEPTICEELPVGVIDDDINSESKKKDEHDDINSGSLPAMEDDSAHDESDSKTRATMIELPMGLSKNDEKDNVMNISEEGAQTENEDTVISEATKHDRANPKTYREVLLAEEGDCNADGKTSSSTDDTTKETQPEQQQQLEEQEEMQSSGESDGWVKIEYKEEGELNSDAPMLPVTTQVNEDTCLEGNGVNKNNFLPELMKEPEGQKKTQEIVAEQGISADDKYTKTLAQEKTGLSPALQELEQPGAKHDGGLNGNAKLLEENEKLRNMMKKLLEAANEQLSVISDLTGRVKDLEKKSARRRRSRRVKAKRYTEATSKLSCKKSS
ncbi:hypothetical protein VNO78_25172 [Psophocarpus tetragonolobus]|uniref:BAG domain-containing protein n=1 Tax=Psophocarpus tetragonolobus TaxID=3891 RepID=A0AAN9S786_PSOTE